MIIADLYETIDEFDFASRHEAQLKFRDWLSLTAHFLIEIYKIT